jgi:hypothetical protein
MSTSDGFEPPHEHHVDVGAAPPVAPASTKRMIAVGAGIVVILVALLVTAFLPRRAVSRELVADVSTQDVAPSVQVAEGVFAFV